MSKAAREARLTQRRRVRFWVKELERESCFIDVSPARKARAEVLGLRSGRGAESECTGACALRTHNQPLPAAPASPPAPNLSQYRLFRVLLLAKFGAREEDGTNADHVHRNDHVHRKVPLYRSGTNTVAGAMRQRVGIAYEE